MNFSQRWYWLKQEIARRLYGRHYDIKFSEEAHEQIAESDDQFDVCLSCGHRWEW